MMRERLTTGTIFIPTVSRVVMVTGVSYSNPLLSSLYPYSLVTAHIFVVQLKAVSW